MAHQNFWQVAPGALIGSAHLASNCQAEDLLIKPVILQALSQSEIPALQEGPVRRYSLKKVTWSMLIKVSSKLMSS